MTHHDRCTLIGGCGGGIVVAVELDDWTIDFGSFCFQVATTAWHASQGLCTFNIFTSAIELHFEQKLFPSHYHSKLGSGFRIGPNSSNHSLMCIVPQCLLP